MHRLKYVLVILIVMMVLSGCNPKNAVETPAQTMTMQSPQEFINPYPIQGTPAGSANNENQSDQSTLHQAYPAPVDSSELPAVLMFPENFVNELNVPSPNNGLAIISGRLLKAGQSNIPYVSALYLAPVVTSDVPNQTPEIKFSLKSNQLAIQNILSGQFIFTDVSPGKYAIVMWTPGKSTFLNDSNGTPVIIEAKPDEVNDIGIIYIK